MFFKELKPKASSSSRDPKNSNNRTNNAYKIQTQKLE